MSIKADAHLANQFIAIRKSLEENRPVVAFQQIESLRDYIYSDSFINFATKDTTPLTKLDKELIFYLFNHAEEMSVPIPRHLQTRIDVIKRKIEAF